MEKNLKPRLSLKETFQNAKVTLVKKKKPGKNELPYSGNFELDYCLKINVQQPNPSLYRFEGFINELGEDMKFGKDIPIGVKNFLFKGAMIRNVEWTIGVVLFTGNDSKIQQNGAEARFKVSSMEQKLHKMIVILFFIQIILSIVAVIVKYFYDKGLLFEFDEYLDNLGSEGNDTLLFVFIRYFILMNSLIPISLIVNLEMVRLTQAYFIGRNIELTNTERNM